MSTRHWTCLNVSTKSKIKLTILQFQTGTINEQKELDKQRKKQARAKSASLKKKLPRETSAIQREERIRQLLLEDKQRQQVTLVLNLVNTKLLFIRSTSNHYMKSIPKSTVNHSFSSVKSNHVNSALIKSPKMLKSCIVS